MTDTSSATSRVFGYPQMMRAGLANMLFPWARCFLWCEDNAVPMLAPAWFKLRLGPYVRREQDKRRYDLLFTDDGYIRGARRAAILMRARRVEEAEATDETADLTVVRFRDLGSFEPALGRSSEIFGELRRITKLEHLPPPPTEPFLAVHVRMGDFQPVDEALLRAGEWNMRLPLAWYVDAITHVRAASGESLPVRVFSDGDPADLAALLAMPQVDLVRGRSAVTDLLDMSQGAGLIASGSTFSFLASYLGQVPTIWFPGQFRRSVIDAPTGEIESEWAPGVQLRSGFLEALTSRCKTR